MVSDAWPGLADLHAGLGISRFFEAYAISAVLGCNKPDPRMYHHASAALNLAPAQCLFGLPGCGRSATTELRAAPARVSHRGPDRCW